MIKKRIVTTLFLISSALIFGGCEYLPNMGQKEEILQQEKKPKMLLKVSTMTVKREDSPILFEYPARVKSIQEATIVARVSGTLLEKHFEEGSYVKKGDLLYRIDPAIYEAKAASAKASLEQSEALLKQAERDLARGERLKKEDAIIQKEYDAIISAYENAKAQLMYSEAQLKESVINLGYCEVVAPFDGVVGRSMQDVGSYVGGANSTNLVTLTKLDPVGVEFAIPESDLQKGLELKKIRAQDGAVKVLLEGDRYRNLGEGKIDFIDSKIDTNTQSIKARALFENSDTTLLPGAFLRVAIKGMVKKDVALVPQKAVMQSAQGTLVYVLIEGKVTPRPVVLGEIQKGMQIVTSGLESGDVVVLDNLMKIRPGMPVEVIETTQNAEMTKVQKQ